MNIPGVFPTKYENQPKTGVIFIIKHLAKKDF